MNPIEAAQICQSAEQALRRGSLNLHQFPGLLKRVIEERLWEQRRVPGLGVVELKSLRELVTAKPRRGWGEDPATIEAVIRNDAEVLTLWREAMKPEPGRNQYTSSVDIINAARTPKGTSRSYTLDRLKRERPDLYDKVRSKKLSAHRAAVLAGFHKEKTPLDQLRHWWGKLSPEDQFTFLREVQRARDAEADAAVLKVGEIIGTRTYNRRLRLPAAGRTPGQLRLQMDLPANRLGPG